MIMPQLFTSSVSSSDVIGRYISLMFTSRAIMLTNHLANIGHH
ncbi:hypothetical protein LINPERHAP1_LOCUS12153 [Linum perenne]